MSTRGAISLKPPIRIERARTHNLREVTCEIPQQALTVVTGVSGSGKSSLVFDTLYAEGQRRFVQSMSTYTRLFLERMERPDVDLVSNIPPALALAQKNTIRNARSTVGTITEINDHLRLLYTNVGETRCLTCGERVLRDDPETGLRELEALPAGAVVLVIAPLALRGLPLEDVVAGLLKHGHRRAWLDEQVVRLDEAGIATLSARAPVELPILVDRLAIGKTARSRMREALEAAFALGGGRARLLIEAPSASASSAAPESKPPASAELDGSKESDSRSAARVRPEIALDRRFTCRGCGREHPEPSPNLFSFNSPLGACPVCQGFGRVTGLDLEKVIPDPRKSLAEGAIAPWQTPANLEMQEWMLRAAEECSVRTKVAYAELAAEEKAFVLDGEPRDGAKKKRGGRKRLGQHFPGVHGFFGWLERKRYKTHVRVLIARYRAYTPCTACGGKRLKPEALAVRAGGLDIAELAALPVGAIAEWADRLAQGPRTQARAARLLDEVRSRLGYLIDVGLHYLTLARQARTLSGGEAQRIHLASALGSRLTDTLYCLDEPTVGLHARDSERLLAVLHRLTEAGNTVVLVEHDPVLIEGADHVIDLGPGGGDRGGRVLHAGPARELPAESETGRWLRDRRSPAGRGAGGDRGSRDLGEDARRDDGASGAGSLPQAEPLVAEGEATPYRALAWRGRRAVQPSGIVIRGARENNLKGITVAIPYAKLTCVTGVSGSGKSTLVEQVLFDNWRRGQGQGVEVGACDGIDGLEPFADVVLMTQAPVGRSARSNAVTYLKAYDEIRKLLAATPAARLARVKPGHFSFNTTGGRCETCGGMGTVTIEMHFMADITVGCDVCGGARFKPKVLEIRYRGRNVNEILALTIEEAESFFADSPRIRGRLAALRAVGLEYLTLGQPTSTLSGGEAQRLKLATFVDASSPSGGQLLLFDEPTTGLHLSDVARLSRVLREIVARGHTVVVVEHNLDFIATADHVIDLGPEGGDAGGEVVAEGSPEEIAARAHTATGRALRAIVAPAARDSKALTKESTTARSRRASGSRSAAVEPAAGERS